MNYRILPTAIGNLLLVASPEALLRVSFDGSWSPSDIAGNWQKGSPLLDTVSTQLIEYFEGRRRHFELPLQPQGAEFQRSVWRALLQIPYGDVVSYSEIARRIERPDAVRAVGTANGSNPIPVIIPCHRVIGANGSLTGFGGGLPLKRWLLAHEGADLSRVRETPQISLFEPLR